MDSFLSDVILKVGAEFALGKGIEVVRRRFQEPEWISKLAKIATDEADVPGARPVVQEWLRRDETRNLLVSPRVGENLERLRASLRQELLAVVNSWDLRSDVAADEVKIEAAVDTILRRTMDDFLAALDPAVDVADRRAEERHRELKRLVRSGHRHDDEGSRLEEARTLLASMPVARLPDPGVLPAGSYMPQGRNPLFAGRSANLQRMAASLKGGGTLALGQVTAASGIGGVGKTQLAVEFIHRYGRYFGGGVFWISFAGEEEIDLQVAAMGGPGYLDLQDGFSALGLEDRVALVKAAWRSELPRLLVFDNCEDLKLLARWRPSSGGCRVLVTTRRSRWAPSLGVVPLAVDVLPRSESLELLGGFLPDQSPAEEPALDGIAHELGDLPLALHLAGSYLRRYREEVTPTAYLAMLHEPRLLEHASLLGRGLTEEDSPTGHVQNVAQTFAFSLERLDVATKADRVALALLARAALLAPGEQIPRDLLISTLGETDEEDRRLERSDGIRRLEELGLLEASGEGFRLHRLLAHFVGDLEWDKETQGQVDEALVEAGRRAGDGWLARPSLLAVIPHLRHGTNQALTQGEDERSASLCSALGHALRAGGDYSAARPLYERALEICERIFGPEHLTTATALYRVAWLLLDAGEPTAAWPFLERALSIYLSAHEQDHPGLAATLTGLAMAVLQVKGSLAIAQSLLERALEIREEVYGHDHQYVGWSLNNLAEVLVAQGKLTTARPLLEKALSIRERLPGSEHPDLSDTFVTIAGLLEGEGDLQAAQQMSEQALTIRRRRWGETHPETAKTLIGVARLLAAQGNRASARTLLERAQGIRERALGPDHPDTMAVRIDLAAIQDQS